MSTGKIVVQAGTAGVRIAITGASVAAVSAATVIVATGGAGAVGLVGYGIYRMLSDNPQADLKENDFEIGTRALEGKNRITMERPRTKRFDPLR